MTMPYDQRAPEERLWTKVLKTDHCWLWLGSKSPKGYGAIQIRGKRLYVHRLTYEWLIGPIPDGLTLDHLCGTRNCVRPTHLEPVTRGENALRGGGPSALNARKIACHKGHPFDERNTLYLRDDERACRECRRINQRRSWPRRSAIRTARRLAALTERADKP